MEGRQILGGRASRDLFGKQYQFQSNHLPAPAHQVLLYKAHQLYYPNTLQVTLHEHQPG